MGVSSRVFSLFFRLHRIRQEPVEVACRLCYGAARGVERIAFEQDGRNIPALAYTLIEIIGVAAVDKRHAAQVHHRAVGQIAVVERAGRAEERREVKVRRQAHLAIEKLKTAQKGTDLAAIKAATEEVQKAFYAVSEKLYKNAAPQGEPNANPNASQAGPQAGGNDDGVVDADYEEVKDN